MAVDDDATQEAPADAPLPTTELDPAVTAAAGPVAYSDHTSSMPVVDYRPPQVRPAWIVGLALLAAGVMMATAAFFLSRTTAPPEPAVPAPAASTTPPPPVAAPPPEPVAPPPVAAVPPAPPTAATTSVPPLATPQARIAEPIICSLHYQYPQMQPVDLALTLVDRGIYNDYDEASLVVGLVLKDGCHGI